MSIPYEGTGRIQQKRRTRNALIEAARTLTASGTTPTVEDTAAAASISRTTAYRYFANQRELLAAAYPAIEMDSLLGDDPPDSVTERVSIAVDELVRRTLDLEPALRAMLRLSLDADTDQEQLLLRRGRAIGWFKDALQPLREQLAEHEIDRLTHALRSCIGIEALVWLCDVAGNTRDEAADIMRWSGQCLLRGALAYAAPASPSDPAP